MGQYTLVIDESEKDAGAKLVDRLSKTWPVKTAFWIKPSDRDRWFLYIAADEFDASNAHQGYMEVLRLVKEMQPPYFDPFQVTLVKSDDPLVRDVMEVHKSLGQVNMSLTNDKGHYLGGMSIEGAYLYPLPNAPSVN